MAAAAAAARSAVVDDDGVSELTAGADRAAVRLATEDEPAADSRAERDHHHVRRATSRASFPLGDRGRIRVVLDRDRELETLVHLVPKRNPDERDVHRSDRDAGSLIDSRRQAEADRDHALVEQIPYRRLEPVQQRRLGLLGRRELAVPRHVALAPDHTGEDLRPADVDADDVAVGIHGRRLP